MSPLATHTPSEASTASAPPGPARRDLLDLESLPTPELARLLEAAAAFRRVLATPSRKKPVLSGTAVANVFFEDSTRTRVSFEWAAKRLGADSVSFASAGSSVSKGETLLDTVRTLESMGVDLVVVRHASSGAPRFLARPPRARASSTPATARTSTRRRACSMPARCSTPGTRSPAGASRSSATSRTSRVARSAIVGFTRARRARHAVRADHAAAGRRLGARRQGRGRHGARHRARWPTRSRAPTP